ncbi:hypothetical protein N7539_006853 [Penicillium diatomitis]|uniref:Uncharacterized protein n=1 Tax=Penicillium diatomitis TaxID=2819901 RepID=A0A9W9X229_9EURO|nr:uncharacterized protein N7539_006853 [Penicillium diatomitis]KAJ5480959.1 hypothetical protein N7539_006853 [Penicillium diatomitis]
MTVIVFVLWVASDAERVVEADDADADDADVEGEIADDSDAEDPVTSDADPDDGDVDDDEGEVDGLKVKRSREDAEGTQRGQARQIKLSLVA